MMHAAIYQNNLLAIKKTNYYLYQQLSAISSNTRFDVFASGDPIDVNIEEIATKSKLYKNPIQDTMADIGQSQNLSRYPFLVYFGIGNGVLFKAMLENFEYLQLLFVIEPEIELIFIALHVADFSKEIEEGRLLILPLGQVNYAYVRELLVKKGLAAYMRLYDLKITRPFYGRYSQLLIDVNRVFIDVIEHYVKSHGNCAKDSLIGDEHFLANIPLMLKSTPFQDLIQLRPSQTAILVATGPSLNKQLELLRSAVNQAIIIAVDASMPILENAGIKPDIVCSIERVELTAKFFEKTSAEFHKDITFVCAALQHKDVFANIKDGQLVIPMRPFHFMRYFKFHSYGYCGIGMSAANMAYDVAYLMGFKNLILIGQDLAYAKDGMSHASGHVFGADEKTKDYNASLIVPAWGGNGTVVTSEVWNLFRNYFIANIAEATGVMRTINATEGGSRIDGAEEISFQLALEQCVYNLPPKQPIVLQPTPPATAALLIASAKFKIQEMLDYAQKTKIEVEELFTDVADFCELATKLNSEGKTAEVDFELMEKLTERIEAIKAKFHEQDFYDIFWEIVQSFVLSQEMIIALIVVKPARDDIEKRVKMVEYVYGHRQWLFLLAGAVDALIFVIERSKGNVEQAADESEELLNRLVEQESN